jgi:hypothetical protein
MATQSRLITATDAAAAIFLLALFLSPEVSSFDPRTFDLFEVLAGGG